MSLLAIPMMTSEILKSVDFKKTQKSRYVENETLFFLKIKKLYVFRYKSNGLSLKIKSVYSFQYLFHHLSLYMSYDSCSKSNTYECQAFPRSHKNLKGQEIAHLKSFYKIVL